MFLLITGACRGFAQETNSKFNLSVKPSVSYEEMIGINSSISSVKASVFYMKQSISATYIDHFT